MFLMWPTVLRAPCPSWSVVRLRWSRRSKLGLGRLAGPGLHRGIRSPADLFEMLLSICCSDEVGNSDRSLD